MKYLVIVYLLLLINSCANIKSTFNNKNLIAPKTDTIKGMFFYEVNVPFNCFSRFDQIEQPNNIIFYDSLIGKKNIETLYNKGVFYFAFADIITKRNGEKGINLFQNIKAIRKFDSSINYVKYMYDSAYNKTLYYDKRKILSYKKIYAEFTFLDFGKAEQLIPTTKSINVVIHI